MVWAFKALLKIKDSSAEDGACEWNVGSKLNLGVKLEIVKAVRAPGADTKLSFEASWNGLAVPYVSPEWAGENGRSPKAEEQTGSEAKESVPVLQFETGYNELSWGEEDVTVENRYKKSCH